MSKKIGMSGNKNKKRHMSNFYIETLGLIVIFIAVILVLTRVFALSARMSARAGILTKAVHLAENAAEAVAASNSPETLQGLLEENGNARLSEDGENAVLYVWYDEDMKPAEDGSFRVEITWKAEGEEPDFAESTVCAYWLEEEEPVYSLETGVYFGGQEVRP